MELDHVLVCCATGAPEAEVLVALGLREGSPNTHPGQGTACRRFFFANAYLELFWVADEAEAQSAAVRPTRLWERWSRRDDPTVSPFALVLRRGRESALATPAWPTWSYRPRYVPAGQGIEFARDTPLREPEIIVLPWRGEPARTGQEPLNHDLLLTRLHAATVGVACRDALSDAAREVQRQGLVSFEPADGPSLRLAFAAAPRRSIDVRPALPLTLQW